MQDGAKRSGSGFERHIGRRGACCLRLRDLSYISPYDDCCGVFGPVKAVQHSMRAALVVAFARDYSDNFVFLLLASQASEWKTSNKISALRTHQEPRKLQTHFCVGLRSHHFRSEGFRHSPRHARRSIHARVTEEKPNLVEIPESEPDSSSTLRKRKVKKRVLPEFYQSVQVTPTRKPSSSSGNPSLHCSMSSSADFSDEDDYSVKSGSASPAPGDTLPWNLPRHERSKRKIQGGSVLDPAERAVLRIAGEW
ncbi:hypothetical protein FQN60_015095, partial [Etheostoma spectabile]